MSASLDEHTQRRYVSFWLAQNWSIHVKYASWQVVYPVPNVRDAVVVMAARALRDVWDARAAWDAVVLRGVVMAVRAVVALRPMVERAVLVRVAGVVVVARDWGLAGVLRITVLVVVRADVVFCDALPGVCARTVAARFSV